MLYVKFTIKDSSKYSDFQKLYNHMVEVRQPGFEFEEEEEAEIEWENITDEKIKEIFNEPNPEEKRYKELIPDYADKFLESYVGFDDERAGKFGFTKTGILNYLESSLEVDMKNLEKLDENFGIVEFSAANFPYGGMERFLITLKAYDLIPVECYNGFTVYKFKWTSDFEHDAIELPEKTSEYLRELEK